MYIHIYERSHFISPSFTQFRLTIKIFRNSLKKRFKRTQEDCSLKIKKDSSILFLFGRQLNKMHQTNHQTTILELKLLTEFSIYKERFTYKYVQLDNLFSIGFFFSSVLKIC